MSADIFLILALVAAGLLIAARFVLKTYAGAKYRSTSFGDVIVGNAQLIGEQDEQNDYFEISHKNGVTLAVIADGATKRKIGKFAAVVAVNTLKANFTGGMYESLGPSEYFAHSFEAIEKTFSDNSVGNKVAATLVAVIVDNDVMHYACVGDGAIIIFRGGELINVPDHSEIGKRTLRKSDAILLCSAGARNSLTEMEILHELSKRKTHPYEKCMNLSKHIREKMFKNQDNASIIALEISKIRPKYEKSAPYPPLSVG
ncbi:MAG: protein phosphatase 2C domain-containing protein [Clostridiales bacterium]|jgi:serine/threonine protein phosphatase PrpC|nr:protein phosphatase 2C domain-containing protein [Clostridiales bacterium]